MGRTRLPNVESNTRCWQTITRNRQQLDKLGLLCGIMAKVELMAGVLADGLNLGLTRMAEACSVASLGQLAWTADWHIRDETYALALRRLIDQQQREPFAVMYGGGS